MLIFKSNPELLPLAQVVTQELFSLENYINDIAMKLFGEIDHTKMILEYLIIVEGDPVYDDGHEIINSEYLNAHSKLNCAIAAYLLGRAKSCAIYATEAKSMESFFDAVGFITNGFFFIGAANEHQEGFLEKSKLASKNGGLAHVENRAMKAQAIQYYKDNHELFSSKDEAAFEIANKVVPAKFATVRGWLKGI